MCAVRVQVLVQQDKLLAMPEGMSYAVAASAPTTLMQRKASVKLVILP